MIIWEAPLGRKVQKHDLVSWYPEDVNNSSFFRWGFGEHDIEDGPQSEEEWTDEMNTKFSDLSSKVVAKEMSQSHKP